MCCVPCKCSAAQRRLTSGHLRTLVIAQGAVAGGGVWHKAEWPVAGGGGGQMLKNFLSAPTAYQPSGSSATVGRNWVSETGLLWADMHCSTPKASQTGPTVSSDRRIADVIT